MSNQTDVPLALQQLVCSSCGHLLKKMEWDQVETCPNECKVSHPVTHDEYVSSNKPKELDGDFLGAW